MATHETFTSNQDLAFLLGPPRPDFGLGNTWFGAVSIWGGPIIGFSAAGNPVVEVSVLGISGVSAVQAEVFGARTFDSFGLASVNVTSIEWSLPGSATVLARYTFATPTPFPLSIARVSGDFRFVDIVNEILGLGGSLQDAFGNFMNGEDMLVGGAANEIMYGGGANDTLDGGAGNDRLSGDQGNDTFIYRTGDGITGENVDGGTGSDGFLAIGAVSNGDLFQSGGSTCPSSTSRRSKTCS